MDPRADMSLREVQYSIAASVLRTNNVDSVQIYVQRRFSSATQDALMEKWEKNLFQNSSIHRSCFSRHCFDAFYVLAFPWLNKN